MTVAEWDWSFDDTTLSDLGTEIIEADGLDDLPDVDTGDSPRFGADGMWGGQDYARARTVTLTMETVATDDITQVSNLAALRSLFTLRRASDGVLKFRPGGDIPKRVYCRARRRNMPLDFTRITRLVRTQVQLVAADPRIYADDGGSGSTSIAAEAPGLTFDATPDFSFGGAASGGSITAANEGDIDAPWVAEIAGPVTDPRITLAATGQRLALVGVIASGDVMTLDSLTRTVLLNGSASRYDWLETNAQWFTLAPGRNEVQFAASAGSGLLTLTWRSAWL